MRWLAVVLAAAVLAGCGGDAPTKKEFVAKGDAICKRLADQSDSIEQGEGLDGAAEFLDKVLVFADDARDDLADLEPPKDGEAVKRVLVQSIDDTIAGARAAQAAAAKGDQAGAMKAIREYADAAIAANKKLQAYGFRECADAG